MRMTDSEIRAYEELVKGAEQTTLTPKVYGYARISTKKQSIERQFRNILKEYPDARIYSEAFTGTRMNRPEWKKLLSVVQSGDIIVFDSVSRMSRNAEEGIETYFQLYEMGVSLVFLKEKYINTEVYAANMKDKIALRGTDEDEIFQGLNNYFRRLAQRQIRIAFEQSEKEVSDLRQRTKEGLATARSKGKTLGAEPGKKRTSRKSEEMKKQILKYSREFGGSLNDTEVMKMTGLARNTYYKYKKELLENAEQT